MQALSEGAVVENIQQIILRISELHGKWLAEEKARAEENIARILQIDGELRADGAYKGLDRARRQAIRQERLKEAGLLTDSENLSGSFKYHTGGVTLYFGGIARSLLPCPHCGLMTNTGYVGVAHEDGRSLRFDPALYHYAQAGHPITVEDVDAEMLLAIMADA
jgi:hypothetical protein